jgi:Zn-dependent protease
VSPVISTSTRLEIAEFVLFIFSVILHEISHGWVALALGDDTAKRAHRLTLNPIEHIDPLGSIIVPALLLLSHTGVVFGWAKPVPVNVSRLRNPRNDAVLTGLAGPAMNLVLVAIADLILHTVHPETFWPVNLLIYFGLINLWLAMFNLIPVPPLDGSAVIERMLPTRWYGPYLAIRPYSMLLVFGVVIIGQSSGAFSSALDNLYRHWVSAAGYS